MDFYETLGVSRSATAEEIDKAYRRLARQHHPDRNIGDDSAAKRFIVLTTAFETLSDPLKKGRYDLSYRPSSPPQRQKTKEDFQREKDEEKKRKEAAKGAVTQADLDAIKCTFFGGNKHQGKSIMTWLNLSDGEKKKGGTRVISVKKREFCRTCVGDGNAMRQCSGCNGRNPEIGWCQVCDGMGAVPVQCTTCNGEGVAPWVIEVVAVRWSPNVQSGHTINVLGAGETGMTGMPPGNLRVVII